MDSMSQRIIGPILIPYTPDCDYSDGEELLSYEKIEALKESFKQYQIIDYQHLFTKEDSAYFLQNIAKPIRVWTSTKETSFTDVTGQDINVPHGSAWLECEVNDEQILKEINDKELVAYSVTVCEKEDADKVLQIYQALDNGTANKNDITGELGRINKKLSQKRTLIRDIENPVMLTVSMVKFPCVNKARFCEHSIEEAKKSMSKKNNNDNDNFITSLQDLIKKYRGTKEDDKDIEEVINNKLEAIKEELRVDKEEILEAVKALLTDEGVPNGAGYIRESYDEKGKLINATEPEVPEDVVDPRTPSQEEVPEDEGNVEKEDEEPVEEVEEVEEPTTETEATKDETTTEEEPTEEKEGTVEKTKVAGKGNKSYKKEEKIPLAQPSAQLSRKNGKLEEEPQKMTIKRNEDDIIYDALKNDLSIKSINMDEVELAGTGLNSTYENDVFLSLLNNKYATEVYKASFSEENTNKAILSTAVFSSFVSKLIQDEPIFQDANYQTGHHGKGYIYELGLGAYDTEDGHLPENFYFDKDPADDVFDVDAREVRCYTQRRKVTISDRQRLANVYGDDLVNKVLEISRKKLFRGVYAARVWGDTTLANTVDVQYRRQDGLIKSAGQQLTSGTDFNVTKASAIFDALFFSLPEEAQNPDDYVFYVPSNVFRAYNAERYSKATDSYYEQISTKIPLSWNDIPVKVSPTLNRADVKTLAYEGNSAVLLTAPDNTNFVVGREAGIELKRNADTSSDTFYETIDTGVAYSIPDYAAVAKITSEDYEALLGE